jgi:hypothetical protein
MHYHRLQGRTAVHSGAAAVPANYDLGDQNAKVGEHQDLTPDTTTAVVEVEAARAKLATCTVKGDGAPSRQGGVTPSPKEPPDQTHVRMVKARSR